MYSRAARGKVPEYPRYVPTIDVDDIPLCEDTIVYEHWADDAESEAEERARKRQKRRQEAAEIYLRGGEVRILTAGLKGPFEGWRNPWGRKRQRRDLKLEAEVPETTVRNTRPALPQAARLYLEKGSQQDPIDLEHDEVVLVASALKGQPLNPFTAKDRGDPLPVAGLAPSSTKRVEDWLKTSDVYARRPRSHAGSSPTPVARPSTQERISPRSRSSPIPAEPEPRTVAEEQPPPRPEAADDAPPSRPGSSSSVPTHESPQRAEAAILEHKRKSLHVIPPSTNLPAFEYRRPRRNQTKVSVNQQSADGPISEDVRKGDTATNELPPPQSARTQSRPTGQLRPKDDSTSMPPLSTETSKASTVQNLPSAQVAPAPNRARPISNNQSTNDLLQELPSTTRSDVHQEGATEPKADAATAANDVDAGHVQRESGKQPPEGYITVTDAAIADVLGNETPVRELETQEMIAAIKPFDFSTIKKPKTGFRGLQSPVTATKAHPAKSSKRASFAGEHALSDDSQMSIKAGMKVKKVTATANGEKVAPRVPLFEERTISAGAVLEDMNGDFLNESLPSISAMFGGKKASAPKGILKSSNAVSSAPALSGNAASTSLRQEAQIPSGQPRQKATEIDLVNEDDSFDLDAAIDDLGSYLGTWDAEQEATKMVA